MEIRKLIEDFANRLSTLVEADALERARAMASEALGMARNGGRRVGRPPKALAAVQKPRKKGPIQLCPVPGCKNRAAPVFGMVCAKHQGLPKTKIKAFREARRAKKLKAKAAS
jgi:hypothetical protein